MLKNNSPSLISVLEDPVYQAGELCNQVIYDFDKTGDGHEYQREKLVDSANRVGWD